MKNGTTSRLLSACAIAYVLASTSAFAQEKALKFKCQNITCFDPLIYACVPHGKVVTKMSYQDGRFEVESQDRSAGAYVFHHLEHSGEDNSRHSAAIFYPLEDPRGTSGVMLFADVIPGSLELRTRGERKKIRISFNGGPDLSCVAE